MPEGLKIQVAADVQQAVKALGTDIPKAADKTAAAFSSMTQTVSSASQVLSKTVATSANNANSAISALANTIKTKGAAGFTVLGEAGSFAGSKLRSLSGVLNSTASQVPVLSSKVQGAGASFAKLATVFGIAGLAGNLLASFVKQLGTEIYNAITGANRLASASSLLAKSQREAAASTKDEVVQLQVLFAVAKDTNNTYIQRKAAIDQINKAYPEFHKNLTLESINTLAVADAVNAVINSLVKKAQVQGLVTTIAALSNTLTELQGLTDKGFVGDLKEKNIKAITSRMNELTAAAIKLQSEVIGKGNAAGVLGGLVQTSIGKEIGRPSEKVVKAPDIKIKPGKVDISDIVDTNADQVAEQIKDGILSARAFNFIKIPIKKVEFDITGGGTAGTEVGDLSDAEKIMAKVGEDTAAAFNSALQDGLTNGISGIGEGIGKALSGGDIGDAFKGFASAIGAALEAMGKQIIGIGLAALLAKEALKSLFANPIVAIAAGTALVAAGAALKNVLSGGIKGFAAGGLVTGPQLALIGEGPGTSRSNPEVVAPLDKLKGMLAGMSGGGLQTVLVTGRLRGNDMLLQNARTSRSQRRTTGR